MAVQPRPRAMKRQGRRWEAKKRPQAATKRNTKSVDDNGSLEKFVAGVMAVMMASWTVAKSSMLFWRSRILRKKSLDISEAGLMVRAGARGGPAMEYWEDLT